MTFNGKIQTFLFVKLSMKTQRRNTCMQSSPEWCLRCKLVGSLYSTLCKTDTLGDARQVKHGYRKYIVCNGSSMPYSGKPFFIWWIFYQFSFEWNIHVISKNLGHIHIVGTFPRDFFTIVTVTTYPLQCSCNCIHSLFPL